MTEISTDTFQLTQSLIVLGSVAGGVFFFLVVANIVLGCLLWINSSERSERQRPSHGHRIRKLTTKGTRSNQQLSGSLRILYRRHSRTDSGCLEDGHDTLAFESAASSESDGTADDVWNTFQGSQSRNRVSHYNESYKRKWDVILANAGKRKGVRLHFNEVSDVGIDNYSLEGKKDQLNDECGNKSKTCFNEPRQKSVEDAKREQGSPSDFNHVRFAPDIGEEHDHNVLHKSFQHDLTSNIREKRTDSQHSEKGCENNVAQPTHDISNEWVGQLTTLEQTNKLPKKDMRQSDVNGDSYNDHPIAFHSNKEVHTSDSISQKRNLQNESYGQNLATMTIISNEHSHEYEQKETFLIKSTNVYHTDIKKQGMSKSDISITGDDDSKTRTSRKGRTEKSLRPGKLYIKRHEYVKKGAKDKTSLRSRTGRISSPTSKLSFIVPYYDETITEEQEGNINNGASLPEIALINKPQEHIKLPPRDQVDRTQRRNNVESNNPINQSVSISRSPVLDWSISDDDKQSYFIQNLSSIDKHDFTIRPIQSVFDNSINTSAYSAGLHSNNDATRLAQSSHTKNTRILKWPVRRKSFMHRLLNRSHPSKSHILKTYYSEDTVFVDIDRSALKGNEAPFQVEKQQVKEALNKKSVNQDKTRSKSVSDEKSLTINKNAKRILQTEFRRPFKKGYHHNMGNRVGLSNFILPRFTLSEDDLGMYPDDSIPTIDELVQNSTIRRKKEKVKRVRQKHSHVIQTSKNLTDTSHQMNLNQPEGQYDDSIGFHTGVSDKYHSISGDKKASLGHLSFHKLFNSKTPKIGFGGPLYIPNPKEKDTKESYVNDVVDQFHDEAPNTDTSGLDDGNWNIDIMTPKSASSKDVDSVSSFALSDFDMGESDVDDVNKSDNDENCTDNDISESQMRDIQDVRL